MKFQHPFTCYTYSTLRHYNLLQEEPTNALGFINVICYIIIMFRPIMWPSSEWGEQEYKLGCVEITLQLENHKILSASSIYITAQNHTPYNNF